MNIPESPDTNTNHRSWVWNGLTVLLFLVAIISLAQVWYGCHSRAEAANTPALWTGNPYNLCAPTLADLNTPPGRDGRLTPLFDGMNSYEYPITTKFEMAQRYFNQGFLLQYGFNHAEAARSFREAIKQDPECAMCYWGLAYVLGPNYNAPMDMEVLTVALDAVNNATLHMVNASPKEQALIEALALRYPSDPDIDPLPFYEAYAEAMKGVMKRFSDDIDIAVMTAEALMNLHPWELWSPEKYPLPWTPEILDILETALQVEPDHPQACHLYIHAMEAGPNPEKAKIYADNLRLRVPDSGHLLHMPSHLYINIGEYHEGTLANQRAVKVDSIYVSACHEAGIYPLIYYPHNWHFLAACAGLEGRGDLALKASMYMADHVVEEEFLRTPGFQTLQHYLTIPWFIQIKFAMWEDILNEEAPADDMPFPVAIWTYAQGMAHTAQGNVDTAQLLLNRMQEIKSEAQLDTFMIFVNTAGEIVSVAEHMLAGYIALQNGDATNAIEHFKLGVEVEDQLKYIEPPDWFFSVRHYLGHAYMEAYDFKNAQLTYQKDLQRYKENGWALRGLMNSYDMQALTSRYEQAKIRYEKAWQYADKPLESSIWQ